MSKQDFNSLDLIRDLSLAFGPPAFEDDVVAVARQYAPKGAFKIEEDSTRNFYIYMKEHNPDLPTVLVDAHADEVGLMVQAVKSNGTIAFVPLGHWVPEVLAAQKMLIKNNRGEFVTGVMASKPPHFGASQGSLEISDLVIDVGATSKQEAIELFGITPACPIAPVPFFEMDEKSQIMKGKAFDCRLGCASVIELMHQIADLNLDVNVVGVLSSQEEIGMRGAKVVANKIKPDIVICFEGTPADDTFAMPDMVQTSLKKGPMLRHIDQGMVTHPRFIRFALDVAAKNGIPTQEAVRAGGATNGGVFHLANQGAPTIVIGHPVRYAHSPNSISHLPDYTHGLNLSREILKALNKDVISSF
ncbi:MAG: M20/M25/M40 family metallo-hydrolase [Defluviitaleaceae bacterium]|nr:M20/M25/M40 family metallo-hydrolase [Defluviitaleaceae bacterium]